MQVEFSQTTHPRTTQSPSEIIPARHANERAVVLLSGGLDSATVLAMARAAGYQCYALSIDYGQRHVAELRAAQQVASTQGVAAHQVIHLNLRQFGGSALTDSAIDVPIDGCSTGIPVTYVPARNTIMLSVALGWAESLGANAIFYGANAVDYSGYPDCRPEYIQAFERMANLATKTGVEQYADGALGLRIFAPIVHLTKAEIIQTGTALGVDFAMTVSCYQADDAGRACGVCDSCRIRAAGFAQAGVADPTRYQNHSAANQ
jgi:7-cyano-7-deazaguanine synthase